MSNSKNSGRGLDGARPRIAGASRRRRRGITSVLALLYLMIFSALALGFFAQTNLSSQVAGNERRTYEAQIAAESGAQFLRYHLGSLTIPGGLTPEQTFERVYLQLSTQLEDTGNLGVKALGYVATKSGAPGVIQIPAGANEYISLGQDGSRFRAVVTDTPPGLTVKFIGNSVNGTTSRAVQFEYQPSRKPFALIGINSLTMGGAAFTDSYDSSKGAYSAASARKNGSVASNGIVTLNNTAKVWGNVRYGKTASAVVAPTAGIWGSASAATEVVAYPSVSLPPAGSYSELGDVNNSGGTSTVAGGTYVINNLTLSGTAKVVWTGPVKLYIKNSYNVSGDVSISTYNNLPENRQLYFLPTCKTASWSGTNVCVGDLYAPDTDFTISGSVQKLGRIIAKNINNTSSGGMHYDEMLPAPAGSTSYTPVATSYLEVR